MTPDAAAVWHASKLLARQPLSVLRLFSMPSSFPPPSLLLPSSLPPPSLLLPSSSL